MVVPNRPNSLAKTSVLLFLLVSAQSGVAAQDPRQSPVEAKHGTLAYRNGVAYVGSKVCEGCHEEIYQAYTQTDMGRSMALPSQQPGLKDLDQPQTVFDRDLNEYFQVFRRGSDFYQGIYSIGWDSKETFRHDEKLEYAVGAGENGVGYVIRRGNYLFEAPLSYYTQSGTWALSPGYESQNYGFGRPALASCVVCHSGRPRPVKARDGLFRNPPFEELAVGCENCHGPGELHARGRALGAPLGGGADRSIVNPGKLLGKLADNICIMCHQGGDVRVLQPGKDYSDFFPGTPLDDTLAVFKAPLKRSSELQSVLLEHYFSMILSECYRAGGGRLSCITCHDPHREFSGQGKVDYYRSRCLGCHTEESCKVALETRRQGTPTDDCAGCHMPRRVVTRIEHAALTEHRILARKAELYPEEAYRADSDAPGLIHLTAVPGSKPLARLTLLEAYQQLIQSGHTEYEEYSAALLRQLVRTNPDNVMVLAALARRGLAKHTPPATSAAIKYLARAVQLGSTTSDDYLLLAELYAGSGQVPKAVEVLKRGIELAPYTREFYESLAVRYVKLGRYGEALQTINKGLEIFPEDKLMRILLQLVRPAILTP